MFSPSPTFTTHPQAHLAHRIQNEIFSSFPPIEFRLLWNRLPFHRRVLVTFRFTATYSQWRSFSFIFLPIKFISQIHNYISRCMRMLHSGCGFFGVRKCIYIVCCFRIAETWPVNLYDCIGCTMSASGILIQRKLFSILVIIKCMF